MTPYLMPLNKGQGVETRHQALPPAGESGHGGGMRRYHFPRVPKLVALASAALMFVLSLSPKDAIEAVRGWVIFFGYLPYPWFTVERLSHYAGLLWMPAAIALIWGLWPSRRNALPAQGAPAPEGAVTAPSGRVKIEHFSMQPTGPGMPRRVIFRVKNRGPGLAYAGVWSLALVMGKSEPTRDVIDKISEEQLVHARSARPESTTILEVDELAMVPTGGTLSEEDWRSVATGQGVLLAVGFYAYLDDSTPAGKVWISALHGLFSGGHANGNMEMAYLRQDTRLYDRLPPSHPAVAP